LAVACWPIDYRGAAEGYGSRIGLIWPDRPVRRLPGSVVGLGSYFGAQYHVPLTYGKT